MSKFNNWSLCCISKTLSDEGTNFRSMTYTNFKKLDKQSAMQKLCDVIAHNFQTALKTILFCQQNDIAGYRLSSNLCPLLTHKDFQMRVCDLPNYSDVVKTAEQIKAALKNKPIRISSHPSEYITLTTDNDEILQSTIRDLEQHSEIFDLLGLEQSYENPLNIHVRKEGDATAISNNFYKNFGKLSDGVKKRLVLENNDNKSGFWTIQNLYKYFYKVLNIPLTFDCLHYRMLNHGESEHDTFHLAKSTWENVTPIFHYSEGIVENGVETRKHADLPQSFPVIYDSNVFYDVELKSKCQAIFKLKQYEQN